MARFSNQKSIHLQYFIGSSTVFGFSEEAQVKTERPPCRMSHPGLQSPRLHHSICSSIIHTAGQHCSYVTEIEEAARQSRASICLQRQKLRPSYVDDCVSAEEQTL